MNKKQIPFKMYNPLTISRSCTLAVFLLFFLFSGKAQNHWNPNTNIYDNYMTIAGYILLNGVELQGVADHQIEVAGFVDDVCRGTYRLYDMGYPGHPFLVFLQAWGSPEDNGKQLTFKMYDHATATECTSAQTAVYEYNGMLGFPTFYEIIITKATQEAPEAPTMASNTTTGITLNEVEGCEYSINGGVWQESPVFAGLTPNTSYTFTQRKAETAIHFASLGSPPATFTTKEVIVPVYTIVSSVNNTDWGTITPYGETEIEEGNDITFTITPNENYEIEKVLVNGTSVDTANTYTFENVQANGTIEVIFKQKVGIETFTNYELLITVYPNPTTSELRVQCSEFNVQYIAIFDVFGKQLQTPPTSPSSPETKFPSNSLERWQMQADGVVINISHLPNGVYFLRITTDKGLVNKKVIKN